MKIFYNLGPWSTSVIKLFRSFSVNVLPSWLRNTDQWKPDYRVVTNEKPRSYEQLDVSSKAIELD